MNRRLDRRSNEPITDQNTNNTSIETPHKSF